MSARLLCAAPLPPAIAGRARAEFGAITSQERQLSTAETIATLQADPTLRAVLISSRIRLDAAAIATLPAHLRLIATCSAGHEHIDVAAADARGIRVTNTPDVVSEATADMALFLMLGAMRRGREYAAIMDRGWRQRFGLGDMLGLDFHGKTLGIVGMGRIGQAVAQRARGFGVKMAAAGLDVFRGEPDYDLRLKESPSLFMMPHMGTATVETRDAMGHRALDNVADVLAGREPLDAL
jgi:lactate dehydrogenase-like 2-hydroxyacid dehydrogenase